MVVQKVGLVAGSGLVGRALAVGFIKAGYEVKIGTRDGSSQKVVDFVKENPKVQVGSNAEAAQFGDVIVLVTNWENVEAAIKDTGKENFSGKVLLDITNPAQLFIEKKRLELIPGINGGETIQKWLPNAHVVKFLNNVGNKLFAFPYETNGVKPVTFVAGDDAGAKKTTTDILHTLGWDNVIDAGPIDSARYLEATGPLWVNAAFAYPHLAFTHNWAFLTKS